MSAARKTARSISKRTQANPGRIACLLIPDLPLAAALRSEPELRGKPLAILEVRPDRRHNRAPAIVAGWMRGMTVTQARAVQPDLEVRALSIEGVHSAHQALVDVASSVTPGVMDATLGLVFLDLDGTQALFPSERGLLTALEARLTDVGLEAARLGIGSTRGVAALAARHRGGGHIVSHAEAQEFLDPLPLDLLDPSEELIDRLWRWGVRTLGELARIARPALGARLGEEGVALARRARGEDLTPFQPSPPRMRFEESLESDFPVGNLETLSFLLRSVLDRLSRRLRIRALAARELLLELTLESGRTSAREVKLAAPTLEVHVLTSLVRLSLENDPPPEPVERARVVATPGNIETAQLDLFMPPLPAPAELAMTVARIESLCGQGTIGAPGLQDTHQPDAARMETFRLEHEKARAQDYEALSHSGTSQARDASWSEAPSLSPRATIALRALRPPRAVRVRAGNQPEHIGPLHEPGLSIAGGVVRQCAGPWRLFGEWWGESRFARDYYDVELSDEGLYRLYHNLEDSSWYIDGIYD